MRWTMILERDCGMAGSVVVVAFYSALSGHNGNIVIRYPGRCPGLENGRPSGGFAWVPVTAMLPEILQCDLDLIGRAAISDQERRSHAVCHDGWTEVHPTGAQRCAL